MDNKILNDNELKKVSGGFHDYEVTEIHYDFTIGDTFEVAENSYYYVVMENAQNVNEDNMILCDQVQRELHVDKGSFTCTKRSKYYVRNIIKWKYVGNCIISY